ncbi:MAG: cytochrome bc complex cytochrome b subunit [Deltaproteobacteria bacterium]|nr:cytochrome bc complex cytochrome b subunit [Deltaproteobacteria bacterium]
MAAGIEHAETKPLKGRIIDLIQEDVPDHLYSWPYTLGAIPLVLFGILLVTGILMTFYYIPYPDRAYESVREITYSIYLGWFIRGMHKLAVHLMILSLLFHITRVFITRAYKEGGEVKWLLGAGIFFTALAFGFTGYALVYDNISYWGMIVVTNMAGELPIIGKTLLLLLRGGEDVTEITLLRLYDLHTKLLPFLIITLLLSHILAVRFFGFAKLGTDLKSVPTQGMHKFFPEHAMEVGLISICLLIFIIDITMLFPPQLGSPANMQEVASNVSPPWYFSAVYKWITIAPRNAALFGVLFFSAIFFAYPYVDRFLTKRGANMQRINIAVGAAAVIVFVILTLWEIVL